MAAYALTPPWWVIVAVSAVPPAMFGAVVHLAVLMGRTEVAGSLTDNACPAPISLEKYEGPVEVTTLVPRPRPVAAAETRRNRVITSVAEPAGAPDLDKLETLRRWRDAHPGEPLSQRRVIKICRTNNSGAKTLLTALEAA